jgi:hypothetical protein
VSSTRGVGMNLARRFNAGNRVVTGSRRVATIDFTLVSGVATRRKNFVRLFPALKGRAKFIPSLRVDSIRSEGPLDWRGLSDKLKFGGHFERNEKSSNHSGLS